jgi:hypothetical protein
MTIMGEENNIRHCTASLHTRPVCPCTLIQIRLLVSVGKTLKNLETNLDKPEETKGSSFSPE